MKWIGVYLTLVSSLNLVFLSPIPSIVDSSSPNVTSTSAIPRMALLTNDMEIDPNGDVKNPQIIDFSGTAATPSRFDIFTPEEDFESFQPETRSIDVETEETSKIFPRLII